MRVLPGPPLRPSYPSSPGRDLPLEGLRGLCALSVFYAHLFIPAAAIDPKWAPPGAFWWFNLGAPAVLMFFVLSGYVIGLATTQPASAPAVHGYLLHRAARLVPLNTVAVLVSWLLLPHVAERTVAGNLLFLQNSEPYPLLGSFPRLVNNSNLWSLNYEAVYYLGFIALWFFAPSTPAVFGIVAFVVCAHSLGLPVPAIIARYACGSLYWLAGLAVAWQTAPAEPAQRRTNWPAAILGFYAIWQVGALRALLYDWELFGWLWITPVSPHRLDLLLASLWLLLAVTGRAPRLCRTLTWTCLAIATAGLIVQGIGGAWPESGVVLAGALAVAWLLAGRNYALMPLQRCAPLGVISYGVYIIASPLQIAQRAVWSEFSGSWLTFTVRVIVLTGLTFTAAWWLERRFGPPISAWIRRAGSAHGKTRAASPAPLPRSS